LWKPRDRARGNDSFGRPIHLSRYYPSKSDGCQLELMNAEQDVTRLRELKLRIEMLISYYRSMGDNERAFVRALEERLCGVSHSLHSIRSGQIC
jgi:hypothetical protein